MGVMVLFHFFMGAGLWLANCQVGVYPGVASSIRLASSGLLGFALFRRKSPAVLAIPIWIAANIVYEAIEFRADANAVIGYVARWLARALPFILVARRSASFRSYRIARATFALLVVIQTAGLVAHILRLRGTIVVNQSPTPSNPAF